MLKIFVHKEFFLFKNNKISSNSYLSSLDEAQRNQGFLKFKMILNLDCAALHQGYKLIYN